MIKMQYDMTGMKPMNRETAAEIAISASKFESTFTMESGNSIINMKSMLGLLSYALPMTGVVNLAAEGSDEAEMMEKMKKILDDLKN